ncbi:hypothetical protein [Bacillus cereus]|uniref:hypothetical protein n=1 Tax=Bacillus cereus TaxID=1396 RepID=UPI000B4B6B02|nr:hypothetical protein [Bacillus cereus]
MSDKFTRISIWEMDNLLVSLEDIIPLLKKDYSQEIDFLQEYEGLSREDKTLLHKWVPKNGKNIQIQSKNILGQNFRYIEVTAIFETKHGKERSIINGEVLQRKLRIFNHSAKVVFFELFGSIYCALEVAATYESRIRSALMGQRRGHKIEAWGKVKDKQVFPFFFDSRFFYWLLSKKESVLAKLPETNPKCDTKMQLVDVSALSLLGDRSSYDSSNQGPGLLTESLTALSGLGCNNNVYLMGVKFKMGSLTLIFRFDSEGKCILNVDRSIYINEKEEMIGIDDDVPFFIGAIYGITFPTLLELYKQEKDSNTWNEDLEKEQRKKWALKVIKDLCVHNNIDKDELNTLLHEN